MRSFTKRVSRTSTAGLAFVAALLLASCGGSPAAVTLVDAGAGGVQDGNDDGNSDGEISYACPVTAPTSCPSPMPHYADVQPILQRRCVPCHQGLPNGPWPLTMYQHVADWQDLVRAVMLDCSMPPADGGMPLPADERLALLVWLRCGIPQ